MDSIAITDSIRESWHPDTSLPTCSINQKSSKRLYHQRNIYRKYRNSEESNPLSDVAWYIFGEIDLQSEYRMIDILYRLACEEPSSELALLTDEIDYLLRDMRALNVGIGFDEEESTEPELFLHDSRRQGLTMNWRRARELYKKLTQK